MSFHWVDWLDSLAPSEEDLSPGYWENSVFLFRIGPHGRLDIALQKGFDRWGNSVLCTVSPPKTARAAAKLLRRLERLADLNPAPDPPQQVYRGRFRTR